MAAPGAVACNKPDGPDAPIPAPCGALRTGERRRSPVAQHGRRPILDPRGRHWGHLWRVQTIGLRMRGFMRRMLATVPGSLTKESPRSIFRDRTETRTQLVAFPAAGTETRTQLVAFPGNQAIKALLSPWPIERPANWTARVNTPLTARELDRVRVSIERGRSYGGDDWVRQMVKDLGLEHTVRSEGRPRKASQPLTDPTS
jgi:hypothetical protein